MLLFFAWGLATAVVAFLFPLSTLWPKTDLKGTLSIWSESWSSSRLPSSGFFPGEGNLSGAETAWPPLEKDAPIPLALPYDLGQLSSSLFYPLTKATHTSSFWGRAPPLWVLWGSSSFSYWKSPVSLFFSAFCSQARSPIADEYFVIWKQPFSSSIIQPSFCCFSSKICCKRTDLSFWLLAHSTVAGSIKTPSLL